MDLDNYPQYPVPVSQSLDLIHQSFKVSHNTRL